MPVGRRPLTVEARVQSQTSSRDICAGQNDTASIGGIGLAGWPLVPKFAGSNPVEAVGFLRAKKSSARLPSEGK